MRPTIIKEYIISRKENIAYDSDIYIYEIIKTHLVELPLYKNCSQASQCTSKNQVKVRFSDT